MKIYSATSEDCYQKVVIYSAGGVVPMCSYILRFVVAVTFCSACIGPLSAQSDIGHSPAVTGGDWRPITTTVYQPKVVSQIVPITQVVYEPKTQYVLQPQWQGWWNPFKPPTLAYQYRPVTHWVPKSVTTNQVVNKQTIEAAQQTTETPKRVAEAGTGQRPVQSAAAYTAMHTPQILLRIPILGGQASLKDYIPSGWPPTSQPPSQGSQAESPKNQAILQGNLPIPSRSPAAYSNIAAIGPIDASQSPYYLQASSAQRMSLYSGITTTGLRPLSAGISQHSSSGYVAPLRTTTGQGRQWDVMQSGLEPTVVR